jgi:hypothetical protein
MKVEYLKDGKIAYYNGYRFTRDDKTGYYLSATKIGDRRLRLHIYVYQCERNREIPKGWNVHHIDGNKAHNDIDNLVCIPQSNHFSYHSKKYTEIHKEEMMKQLEDIRPKASQWHASAEGHEWHKKHYAKMKDALYVKRTFKCLVCGKEFESTKADSKFCCNAHKTRYRNSLGLDNETRKCVVCGGKFSVNKYQPTKTCSKECKKVLLRISRIKSKEAAS